MLFRSEIGVVADLVFDLDQADVAPARRESGRGGVGLDLCGHRDRPAGAFREEFIHVEVAGDAPVVDVILISLAEGALERTESVGLPADIRLETPEVGELDVYVGQGGPPVRLVVAGGAQLVDPERDVPQLVADPSIFWNRVADADHHGVDAVQRGRPNDGEARPGRRKLFNVRHHSNAVLNIPEEAVGRERHPIFVDCFVARHLELVQRPELDVHGVEIENVPVERLLRLPDFIRIDRGEEARRKGLLVLVIVVSFVGAEPDEDADLIARFLIRQVGQVLSVGQFAVHMNEEAQIGILEQIQRRRVRLENSALRTGGQVLSTEHQGLLSRILGAPGRQPRLADHRPDRGSVHVGILFVIDARDREAGFGVAHRQEGVVEPLLFNDLAFAPLAADQVEGGEAHGDGHLVPGGPEAQ